MKRPEESLQKSVCQYLDRVLPDDAFYFAIPNQRGTRSKIENMILKTLGVKAGVPDLCILYKGFAHFVELKAKGRKASDAQTLVAAEIRLAGAGWTLSRSVESVEDSLQRWKIPLKGKLS